MGDLESKFHYMLLTSWLQEEFSNNEILIGIPLQKQKYITQTPGEPNDAAYAHQ